MHFPLWRYGAYAFALAVMSCLAAANVAGSWGLEDGPYRYMMICIPIAVDVGAVVGFLAMRHYFAEGDPVSVVASAAIWLLCGFAEIKGAETWLKANTFSISSPSTKAAEEKNVAITDVAREELNLSDIRKSLAVERRESLRDDLHRREKEALARIEKLRPKTFSTNAAPPASLYAGNELALSFALWLLSQAAWRMAVGRASGTAKTAPAPGPGGSGGLRPEELAALRAWLELGETSLTIRPNPPSPESGRPVGRIGYDHATSGRPTTPNHAQPAITMGAHAQPDAQPITSQLVGYEEEPVGRPDAQPAGYVVGPTSLGAQPDAQTPSLGEVGEGVGAQIRPLSTSGRPDAQPVPPKLGTALRLVEARPALTPFQATVKDMLAAGKSEREIADVTGRKRHEVRAAKAAIRTYTTKGRETL